MDALPLLVAHVLGVQRVAADAGAQTSTSSRGRRSTAASSWAESRTSSPFARSKTCTSAPPARRRSTRRRADAARAAGDERDAPCEVVVVAHGAFLYRFRRWPSIRSATTRSGPSGPISSRTPGGLSLDELTLRRRRASTPSELRATPETLRLQAEVAAAAGRSQLADNLRRAAELAPLPDETILEIYTALRPRRSSAAELESWAERLEALDAPLTAAFVREALRVYATRGLLAA